MPFYRLSTCAALFVLSGVALADEIEHERLTAFVRQIELIEAQAADLGQTAQARRARYHFDYTRLRDDLSRVRAGIADYLTPARAQPRDLAPMADEYRLSIDPDLLP